MPSLTLAVGVHLGRNTSRVIIGCTLGPERHGLTMRLAKAYGIPLSGPSRPCEECERLLPYVDLWRSLTVPSRAYCEDYLPTAVLR